MWKSQHKIIYIGDLPTRCRLDSVQLFYIVITKCFDNVFKSIEKNMFVSNNDLTFQKQIVNFYMKRCKRVLRVL